MKEYIQFAVIWLLFMAMIGIICLLVPKIAKKVNKWFKTDRVIKNPYGLVEEDFEPEPQKDNSEKEKIDE